MIVTTVLAFLALQNASPHDAQVQSDIVVIGDKLKAFRTTVRSRNGKMYCQTKKSTGDKEIDAIGCTALAGCLTELRPRLDASADRKLAADERKRSRAAVEDDLGTCMITRRDMMIADLAERRWNARQGTN